MLYRTRTGVVDFPGFAPLSRAGEWTRRLRGAPRSFVPGIKFAIEPPQTCLSSFLLKTFGENRVPYFLFTSESKSKLGWDFLSVIETGRSLRLRR